MTDLKGFFDLLWMHATMQASNLPCYLPILTGSLKTLFCARSAQCYQHKGSRPLIPNESHRSIDRLHHPVTVPRGLLYCWHSRSSWRQEPRLIIRLLRPGCTQCFFFFIIIWMAIRPLTKKGLTMFYFQSMQWDDNVISGSTTHSWGVWQKCFSEGRIQSHIHPARCLLHRSFWQEELQQQPRAVFYYEWVVACFMCHPL